MAAREVTEIQKTLNEAQAAEPELSIFNSTSQTSIFGKFKYIYAVCSNLVEQLLDAFTADNESEIAKAAPGSDYWIQKKILEFQYNATNPQVTAIDANYVPNYPVVDTTLRIITRAAVKTGPNKTCLIKVAKSDPPQALSGPELTSLNAYVNNSGSPSTNGKGIGFAGVKYTVQSLNPDKIYIGGNVKYDGQYQAVIQATVLAAIKDYLANIDFNGVFTIDGLVDYIQAVPGVLKGGITINDVAIRPDSVAFPGYQYLVQSNYYGIYQYPLTAGYGVEETQAGNTWSDTITFTAQN